VSPAQLAAVALKMEYLQMEEASSTDHSDKLEDSMMEKATKKMMATIKKSMRMTRVKMKITIVSNRDDDVYRLID